MKELCVGLCFLIALVSVIEGLEDTEFDDQNLDVEETGDCECPTTNGRTEFEQMKRYWEIQTGQTEEYKTFSELSHLVLDAGLYDDIDLNLTTSLHNYEFGVSAPVKYRLENGDTLAKFYITEKYEDVLTDGGSTFKVIVKGAHTRNSCAYRDYFDGTYTVCCILREDANIVEFYIMNVNFTSYQLYYSHHEVIHNVKVMSLKTDEPSKDPEHAEKQWCYKGTGYWISDDVKDIESWRITHNGELTHFFTKDEVNDCFDNWYSSAIFSGDSHIGILFGYLQLLRETRRETTVVREENEKKPTTFSRHSALYVSTLTELLVHNLHRILNSYREEEAASDTALKPRLLVMDSGCHDLAYNSTAIYVSNFYQIYDLLTEIKNTENFYIIYQNIPPWPHQLEHNKDRHLNSFVNAATSFWITRHLRKLDIDIVDINSLALPFEDVSPCGMHYICNDGPQGFQGRMGLEAAQRILKLACKTHRPT